MSCNRSYLEHDLFLVISRVRSQEGALDVFISSHCESKPTDFHTLPSFTAQTPPPRSLQRKPWAYPSNMHLYSFLPPRKTLIQRLFSFMCQHHSHKCTLATRGPQLELN